jgi:hypothetical protein
MSAAAAKTRRPTATSRASFSEHGLVAAAG